MPQVYKKLWKKNTWNIKRLVDDSFVPSAQRTSVLYSRLTDFNICPLLSVIQTSKRFHSHHCTEVEFTSFPSGGFTIKVRQSRKQLMVSSILPKNERNSLLSWVEKMLRCEFRSFSGRIDDAINCFWDVLTLSNVKLWLIYKWKMGHTYVAFSEYLNFTYSP